MTNIEPLKIPDIFTNGSKVGTSITFAWGDGIGPEIMAATLKVLAAAGAKLKLEEIVIGEKAYTKGYESGMDDSAWESLRRTQVFLKAPITTPQGGGFKSLNVTVRKSLGLFANVRPCVSYHPFITTKHPQMDLIIIRENEEDTYAGIEHQQTEEVAQCLKLISRPGCERVIRYAFEYAAQNNRKRVTCFVKDNIMKITDGMFHQAFKEISQEYPDIEADHYIVDIGTALLADQPERFDVIVTLNLYGDIISDVAAQIAGSVGLAGSANIGERCAMFEAIHGSAPPIAGKDVANPAALIHGAVMMLVHINQVEVATKVHNALLKAIEDGIHTNDIYTEGTSKELVGTQAFADAVISRLGSAPTQLPAIEYQQSDHQSLHANEKVKRKREKTLVGVDIFLDWTEADRDPDVLGKAMEAVAPEGMYLRLITNRGVKVYPEGLSETYCSDHWRCRFINTKDAAPIMHSQIITLLNNVLDAGFDFIKTENLCLFDGERGYSSGQGE